MPLQVRKIHNAGSILIAAALALGVWGAWAGFIAGDAFSIPHQVSGHIGIMLAGGLLKLGYVFRLASEHEARQYA